MLAAGNTVAVRTGAAPAHRPNIVLIVADDLGFSDAGCYGGEIGTPNIDRLALEGVRFRQAYNCAVCVPSRASLMSGLYPQQGGYQQSGGSLAPHLPTVADLLRAAGYRTCLSGKWGFGEKSRPRAHGFDHAFGILGGASNYFKHATIRPTPVYLDDVEYQRPDDFYMTNAITDQAITFLERDAKSERPFFLYLAYTAPRHRTFTRRIRGRRRPAFLRDRANPMSPTACTGPMRATPRSRCTRHGPTKVVSPCR